MSDAAGLTSSSGGGPPDERTVLLVRQILSVIPAGCSWIVPICDDNGEVIDFRVAAVGEQGGDLYRRRGTRLGARLSELYPSMVGGPLWKAYVEVATTGESAHLPDFRYEDNRAGVVAHALFDVSVHPLLGGLLVWWQRLDENQRRLERTELLGRLGWAEHDLISGASDWSPGMYRIFERDPELGPLSRHEQAAALLPDDRGLSETAWQTLDSGATSDVTVRFHAGEGVKYLRVLSEVAKDSDGTPLKIYAVVQDVTARENSRTEIERLSVQLRNRETTLLAEHRLAAQLQNMIQPLPPEPFELAGLEAMVSYLPAESAVQVGGDWYHAQTLPNGQVVLAIGDVAGHGLEAASGMAHLRFSLTAWLSIGIQDPGQLLEHLNRLCFQLALTATAAVAVYDPASRTMRWARAGHEPPLLTRDGTADPVAAPPGMLLGALDHNTYPVALTQLVPGDLVLFYTDGLVERRDTALATMVDRVRAHLTEVCRDGAEHALTRLKALLHDPSPDDDTCTLAVRVRT
jgi:serine phosphatase RsbU (regulator of sigma subunit)